MVNFYFKIILLGLVSLAILRFSEWDNAINEGYRRDVVVSKECFVKDVSKSFGKYRIKYHIVFEKCDEVKEVFISRFFLDKKILGLKSKNVSLSFLSTNRCLTALSRDDFVYKPQDPSAFLCIKV